MRRMLSIGGMAGTGSILNPYAPRYFVSRYQKDGATYSYGPVIFTPLGPTVVALPEAEETEGCEPVALREDSEVHPLDFGRRCEITAIKRLRGSLRGLEV